MTIIFQDNFETGDYSKWDGNIGLPVVQNVIKHGGTWALKSSASTYYVYKGIAATPDLFVRFYFYPSILTGAAVRAALFYDGGTIEVLYLNPLAGKITLGNGSGGSGGFTANYDWTIDWHCIEVELKAGAGNAVYKCWANGTLIGSDLTATFVVPTTLSIGNTYSDNNWDSYVDDVVIADEYIGPEGATPFGTLIKRRR